MARQIEGKQRKIPFTFAVEPDIVTEFDKIAHRESRSRSDLIAELIASYVKAHSSGNPNYQLEQFGAGLKAYPTIWDDDSVSIEKLQEYSEEELEEMRAKASRFVARVDSMKVTFSKSTDKERLSIVLKRIDHIEQVLKNIDRNLGDPKKLQKMNPEYVRKMYDEMKRLQTDHEKFVKERAVLVEKISGKKIDQNVGN